MSSSNRLHATTQPVPHDVRQAPRAALPDVVEALCAVMTAAATEAECQIALAPRAALTEHWQWAFAGHPVPLGQLVALLEAGPPPGLPPGSDASGPLPAQRCITVAREAVEATRESVAHGTALIEAVSALALTTDELARGPVAALLVGRSSYLWRPLPLLPAASVLPEVALIGTPPSGAPARQQGRKRQKGTRGGAAGQGRP